MKPLRFALAIGVLALSFSVFSAETELKCELNAVSGKWETGWFKKEIVTDIRSKFDPEHLKVIETMDTIPVATSAAQLTKVLGAAPSKVIRVVEGSPRLEWVFQGKKSDLGLAVSYFKGCIASITMSASTANVYSKRTSFP